MWHRKWRGTSYAPAAYCSSTSLCRTLMLFPHLVEEAGTVGVVSFSIRHSPWVACSAKMEGPADSSPILEHYVSDCLSSSVFGIGL